MTSKIVCPLCGSEHMLGTPECWVCLECNSEFEHMTMRYIGEGMCEK